MVKRRPHLLKRFYVSTPYQNEKGDWVVPENNDVPTQISCKAVANGSGQTVNTQDGINVVYSWVIYLDKNVDEFEYGQKVELYTEAGELLGKLNVMRFVRNTFNAKLWV